MWRAAQRATWTIAIVTAACAGRAPGAAPASDRTRPPPAEPPAPSPAAESAARTPVIARSLAAVGLDPDALDRTADPCDDFYQFACGGWIQRTEIPADKPMTMRSFVEIDDHNLEYEHAMLERARSRPGNDPVARQLGAFYGSCMDEAAVEQAGLSPLRPMLGLVDKVKDVHSLTAVLAALDAAGIAGLFELSPIQDAADARYVIANVDQGGLGLPDRDYYLHEDEQSRGLLAAYQSYVESMLAAIGHRGAPQQAREIVALETEIARISKDRVARRDPRGTYHKIDRAGVARVMPRLDWDVYWTTVGLRDVRDVTVTAPEFLAGADQLLAATPPDIWRAYLAFHVADQLAPFASEELENLQFKFISVLTGQPEQSPRWKRCVNHTVQALPDLVGQVFVRDRFAGENKAAAETAIRAVAAAMAGNLDTLRWMDDLTRARARAKLDAMNYQIGYPSQWRSYRFRIDPRTWAANALAARRAEHARQLAKIGKPVDKSDWQIAVPQVDAYYHLQLNGMVFPAGILQPPLYSPAAAVPVNLGAIGVVVGHEVTHGFDDQGVQYDALGNLTDWWQPETQRQFQQRTRCVVDQYNGYEVAGGTRLDGANTVGENIADIGGVKLAYAAYRRLREAAPETTTADGFTEDQQFFLGFGQSWCAKLRPDFERLMATTDVHAPPRWRVDGALAATPEFARAFRCKTGSKMVPAQQCVVW